MLQNVQDLIGPAKVDLYVLLALVLMRISVYCRIARNGVYIIFKI
jgi:hypothetical protein